MSLTVGEWAEVGVAVGTGLLAVATFVVARVTKDLAETTKKAVLLESEPQLRLDEVLVGHDPDAPPDPINGISTQMQLRLWNPGKVRISYDAEYVADEINGISGFSGQGPRGIIHPGGKEIVRLSLIALPAPVPVPSHGKIQFRISYRAAGGTAETLRATLGVDVRFPPKSGCPWVYSDGPYVE